MSRLPLANLVIAGVARGGTTSLYSYLAAHPEVCGSRHKETAFFYPVLQNRPLPPLERYAQEFSHCTGKRYRIEATPGYMYGREKMACAIDETLPDVRIVVILRDPTARALSFFTYYKSRFALPKDMSFGEYVEACEATGSIDNTHHAIAPEYSALHSGAYSEFIEPWFARFGQRFLVTFSDEFQDKAALMRRLCRWLDLNPESVDWNVLRVFNRSAMYRRPLLHHVALKINSVAEPFFRSHAGLKEHLARLYLRVNATRSEEPLGDNDISASRAFFAPYNAKLVEILISHGVTNLPPWLTENHHAVPGTTARSPKLRST